MRGVPGRPDLKNTGGVLRSCRAARHSACGTHAPLDFELPRICGTLLAAELAVEANMANSAPERLEGSTGWNGGEQVEELGAALVHTDVVRCLRAGEASTRSTRGSRRDAMRRRVAQHSSDGPGQNARTVAPGSAGVYVVGAQPEPSLSLG